MGLLTALNAVAQSRTRQTEFSWSQESGTTVKSLNEMADSIPPSLDDVPHEDHEIYRRLAKLQDIYTQVSTAYKTFRNYSKTAQV